MKPGKVRDPGGSFQQSAPLMTLFSTCPDIWLVQPWGATWALHTSYLFLIILPFCSEGLLRCVSFPHPSFPRFYLTTSLSNGERTTCTGLAHFTKPDSAQTLTCLLTAARTKISFRIQNRYLGELSFSLSLLSASSSLNTGRRQRLNRALEGERVKKWRQNIQGGKKNKTCSWEKILESSPWSPSIASIQTM